MAQRAAVKFRLKLFMNDKNLWGVSEVDKSVPSLSRKTASFLSSGLSLTVLANKTGATAVVC